MKGRPILISVLALGLILALTAGLNLAQAPGLQGEVDIQAIPVGTTFTYQGRLTDGGSPADGSYDFQFKLYDAASGGTQVGSTVTKEDVAVSNGLFTVKLDFGEVFDGTALWLEVGVRPGDCSGAFTVLSPRQELTATPYALHARDAWLLTGNGGTNPATNFLGTTDGVSLTLRVSDTIALRLEPTSGTPNLIGGYSGNRVTAGVVGATIGGGGAAHYSSGNSAPNRVSANYGTVSGGLENTASGWCTTVGGGRHNSPAACWPSSAGARATRPAATMPPLAGASATRPAAATPPSAGAGATRPATATPPSAGAGITSPAPSMPPSVGARTTWPTAGMPP